MKIWTFIITTVFVLSCNDVTSHDKIEEYPQEISQLGLEKLYDKSKWFLYCIHSDKVLQFHKELNISDTVTYGELPLNFDNVEIRDDTIEIHFYFYYKNDKVNSTLVSPGPDWGTVFLGGLRHN